MEVTWRFDFSALQKTLALYGEVAKKTWAQVIARQTRELSSFLFKASVVRAPAKGFVWAMARSRGWKIKGSHGISPVAKRLAERVMGGNKSVLAASSDMGLTAFRAGKRGKLLKLGSKKGTAIGSSMAKEWMATDKRYASTDKSGYKVLNWRAVEVWMETMLRSRGRKSLAVGWLAGIKKRLSESQAASGATLKYSVQSKRAWRRWSSEVYIAATKNYVLGQVSSNVPGTFEHPEIIQDGINRTVANMMTYIEPRIGQMHLQLGL